MKIITILMAVISAAIVSNTSISAAEQVSVSVGVFSTPDDFDGMVHLRTEKTKTEPIQLRKTTFSPAINVPAEKLDIYKEAWDPAAAEPVAPLLSVDLPVGAKACRVLIWSSVGDGEKVIWHGRAYDSGAWPKSCMVLFNLTGKTIQLASGDLEKMIPAKEMFIFKGKGEKNGSQVKLFYVDEKDPESAKLVFSSVWQIPHDYQELVVMSPGSSDRNVKIHSVVTKQSDQ